MSSWLGSVFSSAGQQRQQLLAAVAQLRAAALVEGSVLAFDQLDAQSLGSDGDLDLLDQFFQFLALP